MKNLKKTLAVLLSILMLITAVIPTVFAAVDETLLYGDTILTSEKEYRLVSGVIERDIILNSSDKDAQKKCFVLEVDLNNPDVTIIAGYNDGDTDEWIRTPVRTHAEAAEKVRGVNVIGAINGDRYNTETGEPAGLLVMNGVVCHPVNGRPFFAILNDGTAVIRSAGGRTDDVVEAVSGYQILVKNGQNIAPVNKLNPRTAIGLKADGTVVMFVVDGRQDPDSVGMDYPELAQAMIALGCVDVLELDGGGSSTLLAQREATDDLECRNSPSYGYERKVSSSLLVCSSAQPTGIFDHVAFSETDYMCAPYSSISITAKGVDVNGYETALPEGGSVVLESTEYGTLSGTKFQANGNTGKTMVNYVVDGEVLASATLRVTNEADNEVESFIKKIQQFFYDIINTFKLLIDKFNEKVLGKG